MFDWDPVFANAEPVTTSQPVESTRVVYRSRAYMVPDPMVVDVASVTPVVSVTPITEQPTTQSVCVTADVETHVEKPVETPVEKPVEKPVVEKSVAPVAKRIVDCQKALPKPVEVWLGACKPLLEKNYNKGTGYYGNEPRREDEERRVDPTSEYSIQAHKEWKERRAKTAEENAVMQKEALKIQVNLDRILKNQLPGNARYEAGDYEKIGVPIEIAGDGISPLMMAAHKAFCEHRPLVLRPDDILLPIIQAVGIYMLSLNPEMVREKYFKKNGRTTLVVERPDFVMGKDGNAWDLVFDDFATMIAEELGPAARDGLRAQFTTTGKFQNAAYDVALMNACRSVFSYETHTLCGIPLIEMLGTPDDWIELGKKILKISAVISDPEWTAALKTDVVDPLVAAAKAAADGTTNDEAKHWASFYKFESHSGGYNIDGWITLLFPFRHEIPKFNATKPATWQKLSVAEMRKTIRNFAAFMPGFSTVPMKWKYSADGGATVRDYEMRLLAGQIGVCQRPDGFIQPFWGWGVYHSQPLDPRSMVY